MSNEEEKNVSQENPRTQAHHPVLHQVLHRVLTLIFNSKRYSRRGESTAQ